MDTKLVRDRARGQTLEHEQVAARLTTQEIFGIDQLVDLGFFLNRSDFVRAAVREKLSSSAAHTVRDITPSQAEKEILAFLKTHPVAYPSDVASELELDLTLVMNVVQKLLKRGRVREAGNGHA